MDQLSVEMQLLQAILDQDTPCYVCLELVTESDIHSGFYAVVPCCVDRESTCGYIVHSSCAIGIATSANFTLKRLRWFLEKCFVKFP